MGFSVLDVLLGGLEGRRVGALRKVMRFLKQHRLQVMRLAMGRDKKIHLEKWAQEKTDDSREDSECSLLLIKLGIRIQEPK